MSKLLDLPEFNIEKLVAFNFIGAAEELWKEVDEGL
jgi:hypothetical protein